MSLRYCSQTFRIPAGLIAAVRCDSVSRDLEITYESQTILSVSWIHYEMDTLMKFALASLS